MDSKVIEIDGELICSRHNKKVKMIIVGNQIPFLDTLCCTKCLDEKPIVSQKMITLKQAQIIIKEKQAQIDSKPDPNRQQLLEHLQTFSQKMMSAHSIYVQIIDQILRNTQELITSLQGFEQKQELTLIRELEQLYLNKQVQHIDEDQLSKMKGVYQMKIDQAFQKLLAFDEFTKCFSFLKINDIPQYESADWQQAVGKKINITSTDQGKVDSMKPLTYQIIQSTKQKEEIRAIAFNNSGSIIVAACKQDIIVWKFNEGNLIEQRRLKGHTENVTCLSFSKKCNWFASGSGDSIRCWKEQENKDWLSSKPQPMQCEAIYHLILNRDEDQLISSSHGCGDIRVWDVNCQQNHIQFNYQLSKEHFYSVSSIIEIENGNLIEKTQIALRDRDKGDKENDTWQFQTIFNKQRQVIIQRFGKYISIIRKQSKGQLKIESEPINCNSMLSCGALSENGEYLVIWSYFGQEFQVYRIIY